MRPAFKPMRRVPDGTTKSVIAHLYAQCDGAKEVGFVLGLEKSQVYKLAEDGALTLDQVARLTHATQATAGAEYLAALAGGQFIPVEPVDGDASELLKMAAKEFGEVMQSAVEMLSKGESKCGVTVSEMDDAIRVLIAARRACTPVMP